MAKPNNKVRIIGGKWRSRQLSFPNQIACRPTPNRIRETLFNWLSGDLQGAHCLDLFAGTGALGFEALSRGAKSVVMVEQDTSLVAALRDNVTMLQTDQAAIVLSSAGEYLKNCRGEAFDIVFLDPPFYENRLEKLIHFINKNNMLLDKALIYMEFEKDLPLSFLPSNWCGLKNKVAGNVGYGLWQANK